MTFSEVFKLLTQLKTVGGTHVNTCRVLSGGYGKACAHMDIPVPAGGSAMLS